MTLVVPPLRSSVRTSEAAEGLLSRGLKALGIGLIATFAGSAAGGTWFALMAIALDGSAGTLAAPGIVLWGLVFGPMWAIPITMGVLPLLSVFWPSRWVRFRGRVLLSAGPVTAALYMARLLDRGEALGVMSWVLLGAATAGGLAAGLVFRAFEPRNAGPASVPSVPPVL